MERLDAAVAASADRHARLGWPNQLTHFLLGHAEEHDGVAHPLAQIAHVSLSRLSHTTRP